MKVYCQKCKKSFCAAEVNEKTFCPYCQSEILKKKGKDNQTVFKTEENKAYCLKCQKTFGVPSDQEAIECPQCWSGDKPKPLWCRWDKPLEDQRVMEEIDRFMDSNICYGREKILGFPGTSPHPISVAVVAKYCDRHSNNIGVHTREGKCEVGFVGTQAAERQVIAMVAGLMNADYEEVDGYISPGGTEANIVGCWMGRDAKKGEPAAIICSFLTHYSVEKAANILGTEFHRLGTDENGHILMYPLARKIDELAHRGINNIVVVGNAGTTMLGSVDDIPAMNEIIKRAKRQLPLANIHFHIDAAFGGFVVPFIDTLPRIGFGNDCVDSISIDVHKMGLSPYGSGIIMARKGLLERIRTESPYVPGNDCSLCGSRPGVMALSCWAVMRRLGKNGYKEMAKRLVSLANEIREEFQRSGIPTFRNDLNIVAVKGALSPQCQAKFIAHAQDNFPVDMANPSGEKTSIWNVIVMPHTKMELIQECISEMKGE